jgi:site-specific recombinase XerD
MELFYATGLRISELASLKLLQINFETASARVIGKGNKERIVFINNIALDAIKEYMLVRPKDTDVENLFISQKGGAMTVRAIQHMISKYVKKSAIPWSSPHAMRHSFATHKLEGGQICNNKRTARTCKSCHYTDISGCISEKIGTCLQRCPSEGERGKGRVKRE